LSADCGIEVGTIIISFNPRARDDAACRRSQGIDDQPFSRRRPEYGILEKKSHQMRFFQRE
jgi:hypothetical protein